MHPEGSTGRLRCPQHEAYLRLAEGDRSPLADRAHFLSVAARAMRFVLIDDARRRLAARRGGGAPHQALDEGLVPLDSDAERLLALDEAMQRLAELDPRLVRVVECR